MEEAKNGIIAWFHAFAERYINRNRDASSGLRLKYDHSLRVCNLAKEISSTVSKQANLQDIAEIAGLLHDVGRFEQYARYQTFRDDISENHAELGVSILRSSEVLQSLPSDVCETILQAISNHNKYRIPDECKKEHLYCAQLIRDADKIDILDILTTIYDRENNDESGATLGLPDVKGYSKEICNDILSGIVVRSTRLKSLNDFKLLKMGWVYDLNFRHSLEIFQKRDYMGKIYRSLLLDDGEDLSRLYEKVMGYLQNRLS